MFVLDSLFVGGLRFVLEKIADVADRELHPEASGTVLTSDDLESVEVVADLGDRSE